MPVKDTHYVIPGRHGPVHARTYSLGASELRPALVWFHGGGFIGGDLDMPSADWVARSIAEKGFVVVSGDYSKCLDGVHYPIPNDDVLDLWTWVGERAISLGIDPAGIHVGGASAGATLAASLAKRLRDGAGMAPKSVILVSPALHYGLPEAQGDLQAVLFAHADNVLTPDLIRSMSDNYCGGSASAADIYAFPSNGEVSGLPPTFVLNAEIDSLRSSGEDYAARLHQAGVDVVVEYEPGATHGHLNEPDEVHATRSLLRLISWLRIHSLSGGSGQVSSDSSARWAQGLSDRMETGLRQQD